jgi:hypothetical protein
MNMALLTELVLVVLLGFSGIFEHEDEDDGEDDRQPGLFEQPLTDGQLDLRFQPAE